MYLTECVSYNKMSPATVHNCMLKELSVARDSPARGKRGFVPSVAVERVVRHKMLRLNKAAIPICDRWMEVNGWG